MKTVLVMGQSNATGRGTTGEFVIDAGVTVWNNTGDLNTLANLGNSFVTPNRANPPFVSSYNSPSIHFCKYLKRSTGEDVRLILVAYPGIGIDQWMESNGTKGPMYLRMAAVLAAAGITSVDVFVWHQGEHDDTIPRPSLYTDRWNRLILQMTNEGYITASTPIVMNETPAVQVNIPPIINAIVNASPRIGLSKISTFPLIDTIHYDGTYAPRIGFEYLRALSNTQTSFNSIIPDPDYLENDLLTGSNVDGERKRTRVKDVVPQNKWIYAVGYNSFSIPSSSSWTAVPLKARFGDRSLVPSNGSFTPNQSGLWRIYARGWAGGDGSAVSLLDRNNSELQRLAFAPTGAAIMDGEVILDLSAGDPIYLGVRQTGGSTVNVTYDGVAPLYYALEATYLGPQETI